MPGVGFYQRTKPRVNVPKGWDPQQPNHFASLAPVKAATTILSGQVISKKYNATTGVWEWNLGWESGNGIPHIAVQDYDQHDVAEAGVLNGLSCSGQFRIRTAYFKTSPAVPYYEGALLVPDGVTGDIKAVANAAGIVVMGVVSNNMYGPLDISGIDNEAAPDVNGQTLVVEFDTMYMPVHA